MKIQLIPKRASEKVNKDDLPALGAELFEEPYANIFLCARKKSGKTTVLYNILKHCASSDTVVTCFASTVFKDPQWLRIADDLKKRNIKFEGHMSFHDEMTGENRLHELMRKLQKDSQTHKLKEEMKAVEDERRLQKKRKLAQDKRQGKRKRTKVNGVELNDDAEEAIRNALHSKRKRKRLNEGIYKLRHIKTKYDITELPEVMFEEEDMQGLFEKEMALAFAGSNRMKQDENEDLIKRVSKKVDSQYTVPERIIIIDDLSNELRDPVVAHLLKTNRHYKTKVIISSQYVQDMMPSSRKQIDYWLLFGGHSVDKLEVIFYDADTRLSLGQFVQLYKKVTSQPYQFLMLYTAEDSYRRGFDQKRINIKPMDSAAKESDALLEENEEENSDYDDDDGENDYS